MREERDNKLCENYPGIFRDRNAPMNRTCMCWGFPGDGWYDLIDSLCKKLTLIEKISGLKVVASQVKEKFATLRFYYHIDSEAKPIVGEEEASIWYAILEDIIEKAESRSGRTCEICGEYGSEDSGSAERIVTIQAKNVAPGVFRAYIPADDIYAPSNSIIKVTDSNGEELHGVGLAFQSVHADTVADADKRNTAPEGHHITVVVPCDEQAGDPECMTFQLTVVGRGWLVTLCQKHKDIRKKLTEANIPFAAYNDIYAKYVDEDFDHFVVVFDKTKGTSVDMETALTSTPEELKQLLDDAAEVLTVANQKQIPPWISRTFKTLEAVDAF